MACSARAAHCTLTQAPAGCGLVALSLASLSFAVLSGPVGTWSPRLVFPHRLPLGFPPAEQKC